MEVWEALTTKPPYVGSYRVWSESLWRVMYGRGPKSVSENAWCGRARLLPSCPVGSLPLSLRLGRSLALPRQAFSYTL